MRVISYAKAREGKNTLYRKFIAEWLLFNRKCNKIDAEGGGLSVESAAKNSIYSFYIYHVIHWHKEGYYMFQVEYDVKAQRHDHISFHQLKKKCKYKRELIKILLY